jgi:hypothetical protein
MIDDAMLYRRLLNTNMWGARGFTFDDENLFNKSKKFLKYLGYDLTFSESKQKPKYYIYLHTYVVLPCREKQIKELIQEYQGEKR